jgi:hypothetical protein
MIAICNPPRDETNVVADKAESDRWHTIQFSTLDSHNVRVDADELDAAKVAGLTDLRTVVEDWEAWNDEPWPGLEAARQMSDPDTAAFRRDLDERWYRRRAGVIPPAGAATYRPFDVEDVEDAWVADHPTLADTPAGSGIDVARSGDRTVHITAGSNTNRQPGPLDVQYTEQGANHVAQEADLREILGRYPDHPVSIDAVGEGSGLADNLQEAFPEVIRFRSGATPNAETEYKDCWTEGLAALGEWLRDGGSIRSRDLREELLAAARTVTFDERYLASRGSDGAEVLEATSKDAVKEHLGRSPDHLDAALMAAWAADDNTGATKPVRRRSGGSPSTGSL